MQHGIWIVSKEIHNFTDRIHDVRIKWVIKKVKQLFKITVRNPCPSCLIYDGICSYKESYIWETKTKAQTKWGKYENTEKDSEPAKQSKSNPRHKFSWKLLLSVSENIRIRKKLETTLVALKWPLLNEQVKFIML